MLEHSITAPAAPSRVVVLGSTGFIGSHLAAHYARANVEAVMLGSADIDLTEPDAANRLARILGPADTLVFLACRTRDKGDDREALTANLAMADSVAAAVGPSACAHVVYLSSDAVYRSGLTMLREDSPIEPTGMYGMAHAERERIMASACGAAGVPLAILRPCAVYGPGDSHDAYGPNRFLRTALADGVITLFGRGEDERDHIFIADVCGIIARCAERRSAGRLNVATGTAHSFAEVAGIVSGVAGRAVGMRSLPRPLPLVHRRFDVSATRRAFPTLTFTPLEEGLRRTAAQMAAA
jgi:nucleoside-diphosphate-sugar epimerase